MRRNKNVKLDESLRSLINKMINTLTRRKNEIARLVQMANDDNNRPFFHSSEPTTRINELNLEIAHCVLYRDNPDLPHLFRPFIHQCNAYSAYYEPSMRKNYAHRGLILILELLAISSLSTWHQHLTEDQKTLIIVAMILLLCAFPINCMESRVKPEFKIFAVAREIMNHPQIIATLENQNDDLNTSAYIRHTTNTQSLPSGSLYQKSLSLFSRPSNTRVAPEHTDQNDYDYTFEA